MSVPEDPGSWTFEGIIRELEDGRAPQPPWTGQNTAWLLEGHPHLREVRTTEVPIAGPHGVVPARSYRGPRSSGEGLVWVHGGAFISGDLDMPEANWVALELAARGIPVLSVDYRKALHGIAHPIPSDDVLSAWRFARERSEQLLDVDPSRLHLGGASAGATITAGVALRLRDGAGAPPASLLLIYPQVHARLPEPSAIAAAAAERLDPAQRFSKAEVDWLNLRYVGGDSRGLGDGYAFAGESNPAGQQPVYVLVSEHDDLRPSGERYAWQLRESGVDVRLDVEEGAAHGHLNEPGLPEAERSIARMTDWITGPRPGVD